MLALTLWLTAVRQIRARSVEQRRVQGLRKPSRKAFSNGIARARRVTFFAGRQSDFPGMVPQLRLGLENRSAECRRVRWDEPNVPAKNVTSQKRAIKHSADGRKFRGQGYEAFPRMRQCSSKECNEPKAGQQVFGEWNEASLETQSRKRHYDST